MLIFYFRLQRESIDALKIIECLVCKNWVFCHMSLFNIWKSTAIEYLFDSINPIPWFDLIIPIVWFNLIIPITWFGLFTFTRLFFPSPTRRRWWTTLTITFRRIKLVRTRPHAKSMRTVCLYIPSSSRYVNLSWAQPLYNHLLLTTSSVEVIIKYICSDVQSLTFFSMIGFISTL